MINYFDKIKEHNLYLLAPLKEPDEEYNEHLWQVGSIINYDWGLDDKIYGTTPEEAVKNWCSTYEKN